MNIDTHALLAAILGVACGMYYVTRFHNYLIHLVFAFRLVTDKHHTMRLYKDLESQNFYQISRYKFSFLPLDDHLRAVAASRKLVHKSLHDEYVVVGKELLFQAARMGAIPLIISLFLGEAVALFGGAITAILALLWYEAFIAHGQNFEKHAQTTILLRHVYADSGYIDQTIRNSLATEDEAPPLRYTVSVPDPEYIETSPINPILISQEKDEVETENALLQVTSGIALTEHTDPKEFALTWQKLWWGNDIALCVIITVVYWISSARTMGDYFFGPLQLVLFIQLFFVPVWLVITIALRLLAKEHRH